jgi:hypothetical protein
MGVFTSYEMRKGVTLFAYWFQKQKSKSKKQKAKSNNRNLFIRQIHTDVCLGIRV